MTDITRRDFFKLSGVAAVSLLLSKSVEAISKPAAMQVQETPMDFRSAKIDKNITRIRNGAGDLMYLIEGRNKAALVDTGVGVGNLKGYVEKLTGKPLIVIITHGHVDHASGSAQFDEVYMNKKDDALFKEHTVMANRQGYVGACNPPWAQTLTAKNYQPLDEPARFKALSEGMTFDLGGVHLDIYDLPGHTQGMTAILIRENRALISGDGANMFTFLWSGETLGLTSYEESIRHIQKATAGKFDKMYCSHGGGDLTIDYFDRMLENIAIIKAGEDDAVDFEFMGQKSKIAFAIDPAHNRLDGGIGNIVYDPNRINE